LSSRQCFRTVDIQRIINVMYENIKKRNFLGRERKCVTERKYGNKTRKQLKGRSDYEEESDCMIWKYGSGNDSVSFCLLMSCFCFFICIISDINFLLYEVSF